MNKVKYVRLQRLNTDSWITWQLRQKVDWHVAVALTENKLPGWQAVTGSLENPDEEENYETV